MKLDNREITIDDILEKIREEVEHRNLTNSSGILDFSFKDIYTRSGNYLNNSSIQSQEIHETKLYRFVRKVQRLLIKLKLYKLFYPYAPVFKRLIPNKLKYKKGYNVNSLLKIEGEHFVTNAYKIILGRDPDEDGLNNNLNNLRYQEKTKIDILMHIRNSEEGKIKNINIYGLKRKYIIYSAKRFFYHIPVIGYILRIIFSIICLPTILKSVQKSSYELFRNHSQEINRLNKSIYEANEQLQSRFDSTNQFVKNLISNEISEADRRIINMENALHKSEEGVVKRFKDIEQQINLQIDEIGSHFFELIQKLEMHKNNILDEQRKMLLLIDKIRKRIMSEEDHSFDSLYVSFEETFRGTRQLIKERLGFYLSYINKTTFGRKDLSIIDLGCGRGEWIELLKENGYSAKGVDLNRIMIKQCQELNLDVIESDAVDFLKVQKADSFDIITGFQIVEHLRFAILISLFDECLRVLKQEGMVIFETPNPENIIVGSCNFYTDPTHKNPIHPETLKFLLSARGFSKTEILRLHPLDYFGFEYKKDDPISQMAYRFNMEQDYSIVAVKA